MAKRQITPAQEQQILCDLSQTSSAWLIGRKASWFRDNPSIPRNVSGNYDAQSVVAWLLAHHESPPVPDDVFERVLRASETISLHVSDAAESIRRLLTELRDQFGVDGLATFAECLLRELSLVDSPLPKESDIEAVVDEEHVIQRRLARRRFYHDTLQAAVICESCGRVRCGRKWTRPTEKHPADSQTSDICPMCASKRRGDGEKD